MMLVTLSHIRRSLIIKNMPNFDQTGPEGLGPRTGRRMGSCCRGLGCRRFFTKKEESEFLKEEAQTLEEELKAVKERITEIENSK